MRQHVRSMFGFLWTFLLRNTVRVRRKIALGVEEMERRFLLSSANDLTPSDVHYTVQESDQDEFYPLGRTGAIPLEGDIFASSQYTEGDKSFLSSMHLLMGGRIDGTLKYFSSTVATSISQSYVTTSTVTAYDSSQLATGRIRFEGTGSLTFSIAAWAKTLSDNGESTSAQKLDVLYRIKASGNFSLSFVVTTSQDGMVLGVDLDPNETAGKIDTSKATSNLSIVAKKYSVFVDGTMSTDLYPPFESDTRVATAGTKNDNLPDLTGKRLSFVVSAEGTTAIGYDNNSSRKVGTLVDITSRKIKYLVFSSVLQEGNVRNPMDVTIKGKSGRVNPLRSAGSGEPSALDGLFADFAILDQLM